MQGKPWAGGVLSAVQDVVVGAGIAQVNVRELRTCSDPDQYATVRATAEFKVGIILLL